MKVILLLGIWFLMPLLVGAAAVFRIHTLGKQRLHDRLLYAFCSVRDAIALKAIKGEIDEESEIFRFFYLKNAELIHSHKNTGLCFSGVATAMIGRVGNSPKNTPITAETKRLFRQLKHADEEVKQIAGVWIQAMTVMLCENLRAMITRRMVWTFQRRSQDFDRWLSRQFFVPRAVRDIAEVISGLAHAANVDTNAFNHSSSFNSVLA